MKLRTRLTQWIAVTATLLTPCATGSASGRTELTLEGPSGVQVVRITRSPKDHATDRVTKELKPGSDSGNSQLEGTEHDEVTGRTTASAAVFDHQHSTGYVAVQTSWRPAESGQEIGAAVGAPLSPEASPLPRNSMMRMEINRDLETNEVMLTLRGQLRTRGRMTDQVPLATFRVLVYPDLATAESSESDKSGEVLFDGEVALSSKASIRGGFSPDHFVVKSNDDGWLTVEPRNPMAIHVKVGDAEAAVVRLVADTDLIAAEEAGEGESAVPAITWMWAPSPNPARQGVTFQFSLSHRLPAKLTLFDVQGRRVKTLINRVLDAGPQDFTWDRTDSRGNHAKSGMYFARFEADNKSFTKRFVLIR